MSTHKRAETAENTSENTAEQALFSEQRREKILEIVKAEQFVRVSHLERVLNASPASIRRDLRALEEVGLLKRTHGGASSKQAAGFELSLVQKEDRFKAEKAAIAKVAVGLIADGETVMLDAGSTTLQIARELKQRRNIKVVTNAVNIAWELSSSESEVTVTGGTLRRNTLALVGPLAVNALSGLYVDKLFLATNGIDLKQGLTSPNLIEAQTKKAMLESAREVILVADHSKFSRIAFTQVCYLDRVQCVITDAGVPPDFIQALTKMHINVLIAGQPSGAPERPERVVRAKDGHGKS
ncbi:MAG TPA: DeoR/GlpR family DNA-binding transcription regulator [Bryobacteraceae bacterium]|jgi:DeoR family fructose operon transcriptional repressor